MKILSFPHPALTTPTKEWDFSQENSHDKLIEIGTQLEKVLEATPNGAALAANQCGLPHKLFVMKEDIAIQEWLPTICVNPQIVGVLSGNEVTQEGCLSFPGMLLDVRRLNSVIFGFQNIDGEVRSKVLTGFLARVVQHEVEHLNGKTFLESVPRIERFRIIAEMKKRKAAGRA